MLGQQIPVAGGVDITFKEPLGVVGIIVPWNFPMPIAGWGFVPALAAGNTVVLKPAELTPMTALRLQELALEAGLPEGVFTVISGKGSVVGARFVTHPDVRKVCFTGSTEVGKQIMAGCADQVKRVTLELGGKSANIVFADADLEVAAASAPGGVFDNAGQDCCARSRILVERSVYDRFMELLEPAVQSFRVANPDRRGRPDGSADQRAAARDRAVLRRGRRGRRRVPRRPPPTAPASGIRRPSCCPVARRDRVWQEEVFGPVVAVLPVRRRGRRDHGGQRQPVRACRARSGPATSAARCASRVASRPETSASTPTRRCATRHRSEDSSSPGSAASSARTPSTPSPKSRTSSSPSATRSRARLDDKETINEWLA